MSVPSVALEQCSNLTGKMAESATNAFRFSVASLKDFSPDTANTVRKEENRTDHYEDVLGSYLVKLSALQISESDSSEAAMLLKALNDFERIGDHCSNIAGCVVDMAHHDMNTHEALRSARVENKFFSEQYTDFAMKYSLK